MSTPNASGLLGSLLDHILSLCLSLCALGIRCQPQVQVAFLVVYWTIFIVISIVMCTRYLMSTPSASGLLGSLLDHILLLCLSLCALDI